MLHILLMLGGFVLSARMKSPSDIWKKTWTDARRLRVRRMDILDGRVKLLDPGVQWFVLALESLGAKTQHSCDGHGSLREWYITFRGPVELAEYVALLDAQIDVVLSPHRVSKIPVWVLRFGRWLFEKAGGERGTSWEMLAGNRKEFWRATQEAAACSWQKNRTKLGVVARIRLRSAIEADRLGIKKKRNRRLKP